MKTEIVSYCFVFVCREISTSFYERMCIYMKQFKNQKLNRKDHLVIDVVGTIIRILLTPILIWYRLYLWVWDGTMFNKN